MQKNPKDYTTLRILKTTLKRFNKCASKAEGTDGYLNRLIDMEQDVKSYEEQMSYAKQGDTGGYGGEKDEQ